MTHLEFVEGMSRIMDRFGKKRYTTEVNQQVWESWQDLPVNPWLRLINDFLVRKSTPPLPLEFINAAKAETNRRSKVVPIEQGRKVISIFGEAERSEMFKFAQKASQGLIPKVNVFRFVRALQNAIDQHSKINCRNCGDEGLLAARHRDYASNLFVFKCDCNAGRFRTEDWPQWNGSSRSQYIPENEAFRKELDEAVEPDPGPSAS